VAVVALVATLFSPVLIFIALKVLWLSSLLDATSLENDNEVVFSMHKTW